MRKPIPLGGSHGHVGATSTGVTICAKALFGTLGIEIAGARAVVQGYGKVGAGVVNELSQAGLTVKAVADQYGAVFCAAGIDVANRYATSITAAVPVADRPGLDSALTALAPFALAVFPLALLTAFRLLAGLATLAVLCLLASRAGHAFSTLSSSRVRLSAEASQLIAHA